MVSSSPSDVGPIGQQASEILDLLYGRFYSGNQTFSDVASSHWREVGWHTVHKLDGEDNWSLAGAGFGDRVQRNFFNRLRYFGVSLALAGMRDRFGCSHHLWDCGEAVAKSQGRLFSFDCVKQVLALSRVLSILGGDDTFHPFSSVGIRRVCIIGDGYGFLGSLLKVVDPDLIVTSVNLGRGLFFDVYYTALCFPKSLMRIGRSDGCDTDFIFLPAEDYQDLVNMGQDLVFNIASMQEMSLPVIRNYMRYIRGSEGGSPVFYCCNRVEKSLPDGEVIRFCDYGWDSMDEIIFDGYCEWYQTFPKGILPRWTKFDGPFVHRLVRLAG